ncbi:MAG: hypothetical protein QOD12_876 [Verrucomicrobiota bacterium]|jgi:hypothetical protein
MRKLTAAAALATLVCTLTHLSAASEKQIDLATIVTKADAASILGEPVKDAQARNGDGADGYYLRCNYYSQNPGKSLVLRVRQAASGQLEPAKQLEELSAGKSQLKALTGLGEKAAIVSEPRMLMLYVAKGNAFVTVAIGGLEDAKAATEKAKALARKILAQL